MDFLRTVLADQTPLLVLLMGQAAAKEESKFHAARLMPASRPQSAKKPKKPTLTSPTKPRAKPSPSVHATPRRGGNLNRRTGNWASKAQTASDDPLEAVPALEPPVLDWAALELRPPSPPSMQPEPIAYIPEEAPMTHNGSEPQVVERQFFDAVEKGKLKLVDNLIKQGKIDVNVSKSYTDRSRTTFPNTRGWNALHFCAWMNNAELTTALIGRGLSVTAKNLGGQNPLHVAANRNSVDVARVLIQSGVPVDVRNDLRFLQTPLQVAAIKGHLPMIQLLLENGADSTASNENASGPKDCFSLASYLGQSEVVEELLRSFSPGTGSAAIMEAFQWAVSRRRYEVLAALTPFVRLSHETLPYLTSSLASLITQGKLDLAESLMQKCKASNFQMRLTPEVWMAAAARASVTGLRLLHQYDPSSITRTNYKGESALTVAINERASDLVVELIALGADIRQSNCLHLIAATGQDEMLKEVLSRTTPGIAYWTTPDVSGGNVLHRAVSSGNVSVVKQVCAFLQPNHFDLEDTAGFTPLHRAGSYGFATVIEALVDSGANLNVESASRSRNTPLHDAAASGKDEAVRKLVQLGANVDALTSEKKSALDLARKSGYTTTVTLLKSLGAKDESNPRQKRLETGKVELMHFETPAPTQFSYKKGQYSLTDTESGHSHKGTVATKETATEHTKIAASQWRTMRLFLSSTFEDMHAERNHILKHVLPKLRLECAKRHVHLVEVDLRWGVTASEAQSNKTPEICLREADSCTIFTGLIGQRYGWVPGANDVPDDVKVAFEWQSGQSMTQMEIQRGALRKRNDPRCHASFYFRNPIDNLPASGKATFEESDPAKKSKLDKLKAEIEAARRFPIVKYSAKALGVSPDGKVELELEKFGAEYFAHVWQAIQDELAEIDKQIVEHHQDELSFERSYHEEFIEHRNRNFVGRADKVEQLTRFLKSQGAEFKNQPLVVVGEPGSGKSAIMAHFTHECIQHGGVRQHVVHHFVGASPNSTDLRLSLLRVCKEIQVGFGLFTKIDDGSDADTLTEVFHSQIKEVGAKHAQQQLVLIFDAINQFDSAHRSQELQWLQQHLPSNVKLIVSTVPESQTLAVLTARKHPLLMIGTLSEGDRQEIVTETLARHKKKLDQSQLKLFMQKQGTQKPLYLVIACEELRIFGVFEKLSAKIQQLPASLQELIDYAFARLESEHGATLVKDLLCFVQTSRHGLLESELSDLLGVSTQQLAILFLGMELFLRKIGLEGQFDFFHRQIAKAVSRRYLSDDATKRSYHDRLAKYYEKLVDISRPITDLSAAETQPRAIFALPYHLLHAGAGPSLAILLSDLRFCWRKAMAGGVYQLVSDFVAAEPFLAQQTKDASRLQQFRDVKNYVQSNVALIAAHPELTFQHALNSTTASTAVSAAASKHLKSLQGARYVEWLNKPESEGLNNSLLLTMTARSDTNDVCWSPDQTQIASAHRDGSVSLWNTTTGEEMGRITTHQDRVNTVQFSPDGAILVSGGADGLLAIYQAQSRQTIATFRHTTSVNCSDIIVSTGTTTIYVGLEDGTIASYLGNASNFSKGLTWKGSDSGINCITVAPNGRVVSGGNDKTLTIWEAGKSVCRLAGGHDKPIKDCHWSKGSDLVVSSSQDKSLVLWSSKGEVLYRATGHGDNVETCHFGTLNGKDIVVSGSWDRTVRLWLLEKPSGKYTLTEAGQYPGTSHFVNAVHLSRDGTKLAVGSPDHTVKIYRTDSVLTNKKATKSTVVHKVHEMMIRGLDYCKAKSLVATGSWDRTVKLFSIVKDPTSGAKLVEKGTLPAHGKRVNSVKWSSDGSVLISGSMDQTAKVWNPDKKTNTQTLKGHTQNVFFVTMTHDNRYYVTTSADKSVRVWEAETGECVGKLDGHTDWACSAAFTPHSRRLATGSKDKSIRIWDSETGEAVDTLTGHANTILQLAYSEDGKILASASEDHTIKLWDAHSNVELLTLKGHTNEVTCCAFLKGRNDRLVTGSSDKSIRIWDTKTGKALATHFCEGGTISVDVTEEGLIVVGDSAGCLHLLRVYNV